MAFLTVLHGKKGVQIMDMIRPGIRASLKPSCNCFLICTSQFITLCTINCPRFLSRFLQIVDSICICFTYGACGSFVAVYLIVFSIFSLNVFSTAILNHFCPYDERFSCFHQNAAVIINIRFISTFFYSADIVFLWQRQSARGLTFYLVVPLSIGVFLIYGFAVFKKFGILKFVCGFSLSLPTVVHIVISVFIKETVVSSTVSVKISAYQSACFCQLVKQICTWHPWIV